MKFLKDVCVVFILALLTGCGGSGSNSGSSTTYSFVTPKVNSQRVYAYTIIDNSNNTINQTTRNTVTAVNADGSFIYVHDVPSGNSATVNGTTYSTPTETINENNLGQELSYSYINSNGNPVTCTATPHGAGPSYPIAVGQTWTLNFVASCGTATPIPYTQTGSVVDVESVTVPAGTFSAVKLQSTETWTDYNGTTRTETITNWRDINTGVVLKRMINTEYSGTALVNGYPVTKTLSLESQS
jgi:hypothetical protein